jgi:MFS transporter, MFS domain-containing protein family, molybdate-anion transporter
LSARRGARARARPSLSLSTTHPSLRPHPKKTRSGRKKAALTYVLVYSLGCFTKHSSSFSVLLGGRLLCGVATSLLYSAFEAWLVAEHMKRGYEPDLLGGTFARAVLVGNGLVAIVAGLVAQTLVGAFKLGPVAPFDAAAAVLAAGGVVIASTWTENYGDAAASGAAPTGTVAGGAPPAPAPSPSPLASLGAQLRAGAAAIAADPKVALLGAEQALFEGAMYTFVFLWTPALSPNGESVPHGFVFALFMVSCMAGSALAGRLLGGNAARSGSARPEKYMQAVFLAAAGALSVPVLLHVAGGGGKASSKPAPPGAGLSPSGRLLLLAFCGFEALVGVFWPSMMKMRSAYVPEGTRATVTNMFRIPLNAFVCVALYNVSAYPLWAMFGMCALFLGVAAACQRRLAAIVAAEAAGAGAGAGAAAKLGMVGLGAQAAVTASPGPPAGRRV